MSLVGASRSGVSMGMPGTVTSHGPGHLYQHPEAVLSTEVAPVSGVAWHFWIFWNSAFWGGLPYF